VKEIRLSFDINSTLKQYDVHWIEEQLLQLREKVFMEMLVSLAKNYP
jgi:hypothetical protein